MTVVANESQLFQPIGGVGANPRKAGAPVEFACGAAGPPAGPFALTGSGLVATLEILAREYVERSGVQVHCAMRPVRLAAPAELMVYRLVQEAITNISK